MPLILGLRRGNCEGSSSRAGKSMLVEGAQSRLGTVALLEGRAADHLGSGVELAGICPCKSVLLLKQIRLEESRFSSKNKLKTESSYYERICGEISLVSNSPSVYLSYVLIHMNSLPRGLCLAAGRRKTGGPARMSCGGSSPFQ